MINGLFQDQLGLGIEARYVVLRTDAAASFASAGPNMPWQRQPGQPDNGMLISSNPDVLDIGPSFLLGRFAQWIGAQRAPSS